jgi:hypothetical protein
LILHFEWCNLKKSRYLINWKVSMMPRGWRKMFVKYSGE